MHFDETISYLMLNLQWTVTIISLDTFGGKLLDATHSYDPAASRAISFIDKTVPVVPRSWNRHNYKMNGQYLAIWQN